MNYNIALLRNIAIVCIVLHHTLCIYTGWPPNAGLSETLPRYVYFISESLKITGLSVFTFISGYLLYYSKDRISSPILYLQNKTRRILLPCVVFGFIYYVSFPQYMYVDWPSPINGTHLWYLPMLFICMLAGFLIISNKYGVLFSLAIWGLIFIICKEVKFRTISEFINYYPVFVLGYFLNKYNNITSRCKSITFVCGMGGGNSTRIFSNNTF